MQHHLDVVALDIGRSHDHSDERGHYRGRKQDAARQQRKNCNQCRCDCPGEDDRFPPAFVYQVIMSKAQPDQSGEAVNGYRRQVSRRIENPPACPCPQF